MIITTGLQNLKSYFIIVFRGHSWQLILIFFINLTIMICMWHMNDVLFSTVFIYEFVSAFNIKTSWWHHQTKEVKNFKRTLLLGVDRYPQHRQFVFSSFDALHSKYVTMSHSPLFLFKLEHIMGQAANRKDNVPIQGENFVVSGYWYLVKKWYKKEKNS